MYYFTLPTPTGAALLERNDAVNLVTQFFLPDDPARAAEIKECLKRNIANEYLATITLLNEREYTPEELGVDLPCAKLTQIVIGRRALFADLFDHRHEGFTIVANADIFFDGSLAKLNTTDLADGKRMFALLRHEYDAAAEPKLFGPSPVSMDTWIVHSSNKLPLRLFEFAIGQQGCDNKLCYLFELLGYTIYNDPLLLRTYHMHAGGRNYPNGIMEAPVSGVLPTGVAPARLTSPYNRLTAQTLETYELKRGNARLRNYIERKAGAPFVVPRVAGIENNAAVFFYTTSLVCSEAATMVLKNNAGLQFNSTKECMHFANAYLAAFRYCDLYASWEPWSNCTQHIRETQSYVQTKFPKPQISASVFDVFHFVASGDPWTHALRGKKILIISSFAEQMRMQPPAYPVDLFPECTLEYITPPLTQAQEPSRGWDAEFDSFCAKVAACDFDVALCSCGGYGNPLCAFIYEMGKSAIYVGGVLQMYFGIYGQRWLDERKEAVALYRTAAWVRPEVKPEGFNAIEGGCYW